MARVRGVQGRSPLRTPWILQILVATVMSQATVFAGRTMTSYRALELGAGGFGVGLLAACFALVPLLVAVPVGRAVDGRRAATFLRAGALLSFAGTVGLAMSGSLWGLALANVGVGMGLMLSAVAAQGMLARRVPDAGHDIAFGWFTVAASLGQLVGPPLAGYAAQHVGTGPADGLNPRAGLVCAAVTALLGLLVVVRVRRWDDSAESGDDPARPEGPLLGIGSLIRTRGMPQAVTASLALLACVDLMTTFLPVLGQERGVSAVAVGWLLALRGGASLLSRLMVARASAWLGRHRVLVWSMATSACLLVLLPWTSNLLVLGAVMLAVGFLLGLGQPLTMSWVAGMVPPRNRATALAVRLSGNRLGQVLIPASAGVVAASTGTAGVFVMVACLLGGAGISVAVHDVNGGA